MNSLFVLLQTLRLAHHGGLQPHLHCRGGHQLCLPCLGGLLLCLLCLSHVICHLHPGILLCRPSPGLQLCPGHLIHWLHPGCLTHYTNLLPYINWFFEPDQVIRWQSQCPISHSQTMLRLTVHAEQFKGLVT